MKRSIFLVLLLTLSIWCGRLYGLGFRYDNTKPVSLSDSKWGEIPSQQLTDLANRPERVGGYWCNSNDYFYFAGDTKRLNDFLVQYAKLTETPHLLVIHPGKAPAQVMADEKTAKPYNWTFDAISWRSAQKQKWFQKLGVDQWRRVVIVQVWLGDTIQLDQLEVPTNIKIWPSDEIENFIEQHNMKQNLPELPRLRFGVEQDPAAKR